MENDIELFKWLSKRLNKGLPIDNWQRNSLEKLLDNMNDEVNLKTLRLCDIAAIIKQDWKNVFYGAKPYLDAMSTLQSIEKFSMHTGGNSEMFYLDSGRSIVTYFLCNASTWKGEVARNVKKELNRRIK